MLICRCWRALFLLAIVLAATDAAATRSFCIASGDSASLANALTEWSTPPDEDDYVIKLEQGTYLLPGHYTYAQPYAYQNTSLQLLGGYKKNTGCGSGRTILPDNTIFDGQGHAGSRIYIDGGNNMTLEGITFQNFTATVGAESNNDDTSVLTLIQNCVFKNLSQGFASGPFSTTIIRNNLFANNGGSALRLEAAGNSSFVYNNTIGASTATGMTLSTQFGAAIFSNNNVVWGSAGKDIVGLNDADSPVPTVAYSDFVTHSGMLTLNAGNIATDPRFANPANDFHLQVGPIQSQAINAGAASVTLPYPPKDLDGNTRVFGSRIDIGAYEAKVDDQNNFTVTTVSDNNSNANPTVGSLRWAIKNANTTASASKITFALGSCGQLLNITSPLPDLTSQVLIDGYYDQVGNQTNGSTLNTSYAHFDANLCVYLNGVGAQAYALRASGANAAVTVRGIGFVGFTTAAIELAGGGNHQVYGNQFGGLAFITANQKAIWVTGSSGGAYIGGADSTEVVNLIAGSTGPGIQLDNAAGHNAVVNALIGFGTDGVSPVGNQVGVYIFNSPNNSLLYNSIGNSSSAGVQISGASATANTLQYNRIGCTASSYDYYNAGAGVLVSFGAHGNGIGSPLGNIYGGNSIFGNTAPGVWISPSAGSGNSVLGNVIDVAASGGALPVDLGSAGPTANGASTSGPNGGQNFPVLQHVFRTAAARWIEFTLSQPNAPGGAFKVEFYVNTLCSTQGLPQRGSGDLVFARATALLDGTGYEHRWIKLPTATGQLEYVSASATDATGSTSELGACQVESTDMIFRDVFE